MIGNRNKWVPIKGTLMHNSEAAGISSGFPNHFPILSLYLCTARPTRIGLSNWHWNALTHTHSFCVGDGAWAIALHPFGWRENSVNSDAEKPLDQYQHWENCCLLQCPLFIPAQRLPALNHQETKLSNKAPIKQCWGWRQPITEQMTKWEQMATEYFLVLKNKNQTKTPTLLLITWIPLVPYLICKGCSKYKR